jgi:uncharacterized membrane protein YidH (DUF202 family)
MQIQRLLGILLLVVGVVLLIMGIRAFDSFSSQVSKFFTGSPTDRAVWLTLGGLLLAITGATFVLLPIRGLART